MKNIIAESIYQACQIMKQIPDSGPKGYYNLWNKIETYSIPEKRDMALCFKETNPIFRPTPKMIDAMWEVCFVWLKFLDIETRHLVWDKAEGMRWKEIMRKYNISRTTAFNRFNLGCNHILKALKKYNKPINIFDLEGYEQ